MLGRSGRGFILLRYLRDWRFGGDQERCDRGRILERRSHKLGRIDHACLDKVLIFAGGRVEASMMVLGFGQLADDPGTVLTDILGDLPGGGAKRAADDVKARLLVVVGRLDAILRFERAQERHTVARQEMPSSTAARRHAAHHPSSPSSP